MIRGKMLFDNAMETLEKQLKYYTSFNFYDKFSKNKNNEIFKERKKKEVENCTFSPEISKKSNKLQKFSIIQNFSFVYWN